MSDTCPNKTALTDDDLATHAWQLDVPGFGEAGQEKLKNCTALVSRIGGLGGPLAFSLAAAGVGKLILAHAGDLKPSDLNRQILMTRDAPRVRAQHDHCVPVLFSKFKDSRDGGCLFHVTRHLESRLLYMVDQCSQRRLFLTQLFSPLIATGIHECRVADKIRLRCDDVQYLQRGSHPLCQINCLCCHWIVRFVEGDAK